VGIRPAQEVARRTLCFNKKKHFLFRRKTLRIRSKSKTPALRAFQNLMELVVAALLRLIVVLVPIAWIVLLFRAWLLLGSLERVLFGLTLRVVVLCLNQC
jgi:hypothetical protein